MIMREALSMPPTSFYHPPPPPHLDYGMMPGGPQMAGSPMAGRMGHHPGHPALLPGTGGLYSFGDLPMSSPASSFQMSMVETSTPTNVSSRGGAGAVPPFRGGMGDMTGIKDLNHYLPVHKVRVEGNPRRVFTVENMVTRETIVVLTCVQKVMLFTLKIKNESESKSPAEKFEFVKFHELHLQPDDLEGFVISQNCSITLVPFKLTYAISTRNESTVYVYNHNNQEGTSSNQVPELITLRNISDKENINSGLIELEHDTPVTHLAIDSEKEYLACVQELGAIVVWDINTQSRLAVFHIPNQAVYISFHRSEPYQLLAIDSSGWIRFFNVFTQTCFRSMHLVHSNVFSAEWSLNNSDILVAGFAESFAVIDTCKLLSSMIKYYDVPELVINCVKVDPSDDKVYATLSRLTGTIQLWRDNFGTHIWKHRNAHVNDIAFARNFLLALGHQTVYFYDTSIS